jgi:hypothetical protein
MGAPSMVAAERKEATPAGSEWGRGVAAASRGVDAYVRGTSWKYQVGSSSGFCGGVLP